MHPLAHIVAAQKAGRPIGIMSACTANAYAITAVLERAKARNVAALIESTANQVDQNGGYTGMTPADFDRYVRDLARAVDFPDDKLILGGDHLGPLTVSKQPEAEAMVYAETLVRDYVIAGFTKIHIDTSMRLLDDDPNAPLSDETIARRGAFLCDAAESAFAERKRLHSDAQAPVYVIGSEVPIPGGAQESEESVTVTSPEACQQTIAAFQRAFRAQSLGDEVWQRVIAVVVQPGVEFGDADVCEYDRAKAKRLTESLQTIPELVFEGHSTDYQTPQALREMVEDGIAILKVGPALTFALREGLFALESMERELLAPSEAPSDFRAALEREMLAAPAHWQKHYHGTEEELRYARAFSFSDRARYYLPDEPVRAAIDLLIANLQKRALPLTLISQYMPLQYNAIRAGKLRNDPEELLKDRVGNCIDDYLYATLG